MTRYRWWWSWSSDAFEMYLEEMAAKGYILDHADFGLIRLTFNEAEPQSIRYCVDYNNQYSQEYELLLEDDGWVCRGKSSGWRIWVKAYKEHRPELFSDKMSIIERNKRLLRFLFIILMTQIPVAVINFSSISQGTDGLLSRFGLTVAILYTITLTLLIYSVARIWLQNQRLKQI